MTGLRELMLPPGVEVADEDGWNQCVHCGYCCKQAPCPVANHLYPGHTGDCPGLVVTEEGGFRLYKCAHAVAFQEELSIGQGCCSVLNSDRWPYLEATGVLRRKTDG